MNEILALFATVSTIVGDIPKAIAALGALIQMIKDAEATGEDGPTKEAKVLNDFEALLNTVNPSWGADFAKIAPMVSAAITFVVAEINSFNALKPSPV